METRVCSEHMNPKQKEEEKIDIRSLAEKRHWLRVGDVVFATGEYKKIMSQEPNFDGGKIAEFDDPSNSKNKTASSVAYVEMPCGCVKYINTGWLTRNKEI